jgi:hypothetical protein
MVRRSDIWGFITPKFPLIPNVLSSVIRELSPSIPMIPIRGYTTHSFSVFHMVISFSFPLMNFKIEQQHRRRCVICWTNKERRAWRRRCAEKLLQSHLRLFGLFGDWVSCSFIKTSGLKLCIVFNMPFGAILHLPIYGKYVLFYSVFLSYMSSFLVLLNGLFFFLT